MARITNDKYYTPKEVVDRCLKILSETIPVKEVTEIIEPSAEGIIQADFLTLDLPYKKGRLIVGNPPFGTHNSKSIRFFNKSAEIADYIAFIQPISQLNNNLQMYKFDLIRSVDLGIAHYTDRDLHCCFNIYKRPAGGLNSKPDFRLKDVTIIEYRRKSDNHSYTTAKNKEVTPDFDFSICNWGNGSLGKTPEYLGQYAQEAYIYVHNPIYKDQVKALLEFETIRRFASSIASKRISVMRLYKYLKDNIEGIK